MNLISNALVLVFVIFLAGCDKINAITMPPAEKINLAFPVSMEIGNAQGTLFMALESDKKEKLRAVDQFNQLLIVRALTCAGTTRIGRFETALEIKSKITDIECFKKQDGRLAEWIGVQRIGQALRLPALRSYTELKGRVVIPSSENSVSMIAAVRANVAVVKNNSGKFTAIDLSGGKPISSFQSPGEAYRFASISPNGRMLAVPVSNRSLTIFDLENGAILWSTDKYSDLVAWIPEVEAIVLNETGASKAALLDLRTGNAEPYLSAERNLAWAVSMPSATNQFLIGSQNSGSLMEHARLVDGSISINTIKQWRLNGSGASSLVPMLMLNGKLLAFVSGRDLGWLNIETGEQGLWAMSAIRGYGFTKLDETSIFFTDSKRNAQASNQKILDVERLTVSAVQDLNPNEGYPLTFTPRSGHAKSINSAVVIQSSVQSDNPQPLSQLIAEALLEEQLAKLQTTAEAPAQFVLTKYLPAEIAAAQAAVVSIGAALAEADAKPSGQRQGYIALLTQQVRAANVLSAMQEGLPRDVVEKMRNGTQQKSVNGAVGATQSPSIKPMLAEVPSNAQVAAIGVYQAPRGAPAKPGVGSSHPTGDIRVNIGPGSTPLVLVLSSYEPVRWTVKNANNRKIAAVLLSSYHDSSVLGLGSTKVLKIGTTHAYKLDSPEYERLKTEVSRYVSNPVTSFQGRYEGQEFTIAQ